MKFTKKKLELKKRTFVSKAFNSSDSRKQDKVLSQKVLGNMIMILDLENNFL